MHLPALKITPLFRSDGSGTTYAFTNYLSDISSTWRSKVGFATSVSFPTGVGGKGNAGVTAILESTNGSIAYAEVAYLVAHALPAAAIKNSAGRYEYPNLNNIESAARTIHHVPASNEMHIVNPPRSAKIAYPISTFTYAIVPAAAPQGGLIKQFVNYVLGKGQAFGPAVGLRSDPKDRGQRGARHAEQDPLAGGQQYLLIDRSGLAGAIPPARVAQSCVST